MTNHTLGSMQHTALNATVCGTYVDMGSPTILCAAILHLAKVT